MPDTKGSPCVYLAGPDVFYPDAKNRAKKMKRALARRGMLGLFPMDNKFSPKKFPDAKELGLAIGNANEAMMMKADIIIANIQPWRGPEADDGTSYEVGFMAALSKLVVLHSADTRSFAERVIYDTYKGKVHQDGLFTRGDVDEMMVEEFPEFSDNLMLINAATNSIRKAVNRLPDPGTVVQRTFLEAADLARWLWEERKSGARAPGWQSPSNGRLKWTH